MPVDTISYWIARCDVCRGTLDDPDTLAPALYDELGDAADAVKRAGWTVAWGHMVCPAENAAHDRARRNANA